MLDPSVFNVTRNYQPDSKSVFLQDPPGLIDSVNRDHQELFDLYKLQKDADWDENEFRLEQCQSEFVSRPAWRANRMLQNISWQWEGDSTASHSLVVAAAPFVTSTDCWLGIVRINDNENLHALSYSEIFKQGLGGDSRVRMAAMLLNQDVLKRLKVVTDILGHIKRVGCKLGLGLIERDSDEAIEAAIMLSAIMLGLERVQFVQSFATTFAIGNIGEFMPIVETVQKIAIDEFTFHVPFHKYIVRNEMRTVRGARAIQNIRPAIEKAYAEIATSELEFNRYLHQDGEELPGVTERMFEDNIYYALSDVYNTWGWKNPHREVLKNPLPYMEDWLNINKNQGSPQEKRGGNYLLSDAVASDKPVDFDVDDL